MKEGQVVICTNDALGSLRNLARQGNDVPEIGKEYTIREVLINPELQLVSIRFKEIENEEMVYTDGGVECSFLAQCFVSKNPYNQYAVFT